MSKRRRQQPIDPNMPVIPPIVNPPGPNASMDVLRAHHDKVQYVFAVYAYDYLIRVCHWCLSDAPLPHGDPGKRGGTRKFCSERCAEAQAAYTTQLYSKPITEITELVGEEGEGRTELEFSQETKA